MNPSLIVVNLLPVIGILFFDWSLYSLLLLYWTESAIIGFYTIIKMLKAENGESAKKAFMIPFFMVHFGIFMSVHLVFLSAFFASNETEASLITSLINIWPFIIGLFISHGISYYSNFIGKGEYKSVALEKIMTAPYPRVVVMHLIIIFSGFFVMILSFTPFYRAAMAMVVLLKIFLDNKAHTWEHKMLESA